MKHLKIIMGLVLCLSLTIPAFSQISLTDGVPYTSSTSPGDFQYYQTHDFWSVVGTRPSSGSDCDLLLYDDSGHNTLLATSALGGQTIDFIVGDYNHNPVPQYDYPEVALESGSGYTIEWEDGTEELQPGTNGPYTWSSDHVVKCWDVYLTAGQEYDFDLSVASGTADLGFALFKSNGAAYYAGRVSAQVSADAHGPGQSESFSYTAPTTDEYGLVVWCNNSNATATYSINIPWELISGTVYNSIFLPGYYKYNQTNNYWAVTGIRPPSGYDCDLKLYDDVNFSTLLAYSLYSGDSVDFVVGDYNHNTTPQWDYPEVIQYFGTSSYDIEYEDGADMLNAPANNGPFSWDTFHVVKCWDVLLTAGQQYDFNLNVASGTADLGFALFKSNGATYYAGRDAAQISADAYGPGQSESFTYTATTTDYYGAVVWCNNSNATANYSLNITYPIVPVELTGGTVYSDSTLPGYYKYHQTNGYWAVTGIRPPGGSDYDLNLYEGSNYIDLLAFSDYSDSTVDFVVGDYNHNTTPQWDYPEVVQWMGTGDYYIEWEDGTGTLSAPGNNGPFSWASNHVVKCWDVLLTAGQQYDFNLSVASGTADLGFALYKSNGATYYAGRSSYQVYADTYGSGQSESFTYTAPDTDDYGLVVWCNNSSATANYSLNITVPIVPVELAGGTVYSDSTLPGYYKYHQTNDYWAVTGIRPPSGSNFNLYLYDDVNFSTLLASSTLIGAHVDFVVGDYNHNTTPQWDYPEVVQYSDSGTYYIQWEDGTATLSAPGDNGPFTWNSNHVVKCWDVNLTAGQQYDFNLSVASGTADLGFALFKSNGATYYAGRDSAQISADAHGSGQSESFTYTATTTDNYGLVVWCNNSSATAAYNVNISFTTGVIQTLTPTTPTAYALDDATPNPFNPATTIGFALPQAIKVTLNVYDVTGRLVTTLLDGQRAAGWYQVTFDGSNLPSGVYLYTMKAGVYSATGKMVLLK